jgi:hypothetical protein
MKSIIFLFALTLFFSLVMPPQKAISQQRYSFTLDTLSGTDSQTFALPDAYGDDEINQLATWQVRLTRIADTATVYVYVEESIDDASSSPDYVIVQTVANGITIGPSNTESKYLIHVPIRGKKQRLRITNAGSSSLVQVEVDAWTRQKVPLTVTDEF